MEGMKHRRRDGPAHFSLDSRGSLDPEIAGWRDLQHVFFDFAKKTLTRRQCGNIFLPHVRFMKRDEMFKLVCELLRDSPELEGTEITDETNPFTEPRQGQP